MMNQSRLPTLLLIFILCFSPWPTSGETVLSPFEARCADDCPLKHYTSKYDVLCADSCEQRGNDSYWCNTPNGWDYCSPRSNVDHEGNACHKDYPCDKYGEDYYRCRLENGDWRRCARVEPRARIHQTIYLKDCIDECRYYESGNYFWCHTQGSWDYCSPRPDVTYRGAPCRPDHKCGAYGSRYSWCYTTDNNNWGYCGATSPGGCACSPPHRSKRQPNNQRLIRTVNNNGRQINVFAETVSGGFAQINARLRREALDLINHWNNQGLGNQARSNLISSENFRIDLQGTIPRNNQHYYNLQVQRNIPRGGRSTTVSQIIVPPDTSAENMRMAFIESLNGEVRIVLEPVR